MKDLRAIAFYLPQFHPVPENDEWWGNGFTEWQNVAKARRLFPGHYQPHLPADLGFYDLRLPEVRAAQAALAREYGIHGFCYYHYWFNGRRILERPFNEVLSSGAPDLPFCLCWANENWTRVWDGGERNILLEQNYSEQDDREHIQSLIPAFKDARYIRVHGKPLFLVYRTELLPDPRRTAAIWQEEATCAGLPGLYLARVENFVRGTDPKEIGFDAGVEFAPDSTHGGRMLYRGALARWLGKLGMLPRVFRDGNVFSYRATVEGMLSRPNVPYRRFRCVSPMWDNSARRNSNSRVYIGATPELYRRWLREIVVRTRRIHESDEQLVFINAWNEWAEGAHLEPDQRWGRAYLAATQAGLQEGLQAPLSADNANPLPDDGRRQGVCRRLQTAYWAALTTLAEIVQGTKLILWQLKQKLPPQ